MFFLDLVWDHLGPSPALLSQFEICHLGYSFFDNSRLGYQCSRCYNLPLVKIRSLASPISSCTIFKILIVDIEPIPHLCDAESIMVKSAVAEILIPSNKRPMSAIKATIKLIFDKTIAHFNCYEKWARPRQPTLSKYELATIVADGMFWS